MRIFNPKLKPEYIEHGCIPDEEDDKLDECCLISEKKLIASIIDVTDIRYDKKKSDMLAIDITQWSTLSRGSVYSDKIFCGMANVFLNDIYYPDDYIPKHMTC